MKKQVLLYILPVLIFISACQKNEVDTLFKDTPEARTNAEIAEVKSDLIGSQYGWMSEYYYNDSVMHTTLLFKFKEDNRVEIISVFDDYLNKVSNFKMKYAQQLDLTFDTYSVLSFLMDETHFADFRWELENTGEGEYKFISRADKSEGISYLTLKKADANADARMVELTEIHQIRKKLVRDMSQSFFRNLVFTALADKYSFEFDQYKDEVTFTGVSDGKIVSFKTKIEITREGKVILQDPLVVDGKQIREFLFVEEDNTLVITDSDGLEGSVMYDRAPAFTVTGIADFFLSNNMNFASEYSVALQQYYDGMKEAVPTLTGTQLYSQWGYLLLFSNTPPAGSTQRHDGFAGVKYMKVAEDLIYIDSSAAGIFRGDDWFKALISSNQAAQVFFGAYFFDPQGLYVVYDSPGFLYLVSKSYPQLYMKISQE